MDNDVKEAREHMLQIAICWQHNGASHYKQAMEAKTIYMWGGMATCDRYKHHMELASAFYREARNILLIL